MEDTVRHRFPQKRDVTRNHPWLGILMEAVDWRLRRWLGVSEYTQSSDCIFRMQIVRNADYIVLKDGTFLRPGDRIIDLHLWNQQVPLMPEAGPTLGWARRMNDSFRRSLQELAHHLAARTDVDDIIAQTRLLLDSPDLRMKIGQQARARVVRDYDMARNAQRFAAELKQRLGTIPRANQNP